MKGSCNDSNPKVVCRVYDLHGVEGKFKLCEECRTDPLFSGYIREKKIE